MYAGAWFGTHQFLDFSDFTCTSRKSTQVLYMRPQIFHTVSLHSLKKNYSSHSNQLRLSKHC